MTHRSYTISNVCHPERITSFVEKIAKPIYLQHTKKTFIFVSFLFPNDNKTNLCTLVLAGCSSVYCERWQGEDKWDVISLTISVTSGSFSF